MLPEEDLRAYERAGRIAAKALAYGLDIVHEGMPVLELCERIEDYIRSMGGKPAFPCNVSINEVAAHYTAKPEDTLVVPKGAVVKIDVGVHVDGRIADTAATVSFDPAYERLVEAARRALEAAIETARAGVPLARIGLEVERAITALGFRPVRNLTGHKIEPWILHAGKSVPNIPEGSGVMLEGEVYAIEPFATDGAGCVRDGDETTIFSYAGGKVKDKRARALLRAIWQAYRRLPFCERWLPRDLGTYGDEERTAFRELLRKKSLHSYPVLIEAGGGRVAQFEHTIVVTKEGALVLTAEG